ncbi:MAG: hypothetical protein H8E55_42965 [Pelagibacterales bacterium]|nr:hypothetical protein [Pelagibacterales bacterium]
MEEERNTEKREPAEKNGLNRVRKGVNLRVERGAEKRELRGVSQNVSFSLYIINNI